MGLDKNFNTAGANEVQLGDGPLQPDLSTLGDSLKEGKPLADTGELYSTIQDAESAASSFVFVPPGTFNESVTIDTAGLTLVGAGYDTLIDGASTDHAVHATVDDVIVKNIRVRTDSGTNLDGVRFAGSTDPTGCSAIGVSATNAGDEGINSRGFESTIVNCRSTGDSHGVQLQEKGRDSRSVVAYSIIQNTGGNGVNLNAADCLCANNIIIGSGGNGVNAQGSDDSVVIGNRVHNAGNTGISGLQNADVIYANNRVSDSTNADIDVGGTANPKTDANLTGSAN